MPTITNANHAAQLDTSRRSYISTEAYKTAFYAYTPATIDGAGNTVAGYLTSYSSGSDSDFPARRVLRETGKKLYPGVHSGVSTYMVSVYDSVKMWNGFIDPNSPYFAVYNGDKSNFIVDGVDSGAPVITNGLVLAGKGLGYEIVGDVSGVTQVTSRTTTVVLNAVTGKITLFSAALNANLTNTFTLTNSFIGANDFLLVNHKSGGTVGDYTISSVCANGSANITLRNVTGGNITSEAPIIQFMILKVL